ncbi:MAG: fumarylacetoacetate hydrolase family protein [Hyphomicrobiales bacterium]|nr:fumarylacetoacetate hydrolase family protein [Hyphomicrobiales bacterium]
MNFVVAPPAVTSIPVSGSDDRFPVRRVFCVGRNYEAHAREMGRDPTREPPFFFTKPADAVVPNGAAVPYPPETKNLHHEIELVVAIGKDGFEIPEDKALDHVFGYAVGIDLTRRDLQFAARDLGRPWDWGKAFDNSAPIAPLQPAARIGHPAKGRIWLSVNGAIRQDADIADLIWSVPEIVSICSRSMRLKAGDIIMTGTPAGVGAMAAGDKVEGGVDGVGTISITIAPPAK